MTMGRAIGGTVEKVRSIAQAPGLSDVDGHALAGFIEAEGCFTITPNNGGRNWKCVMSLVQRADDVDMIGDIVRVTGLGRLHPRPACGNSHPQVGWSVASKVECRELVRLLRRYPLRGRKSEEFRVWSGAVDEWADTLYGSSRPGTDRVIRACATDLLRLRCYVDSSRPIGNADGLLPFLGGFFTGEGSFRLDTAASTCIHLRADDRGLLEALRDAFDVGVVRTSTPRGAHPTARWHVCRQAQLPRLIATLDAAILRGRKRREFDAWRRGAIEFTRGRDRDRAALASAREALMGARAYVERPLPPPPHRSARDAYAEVLRAFADEAADGLLSTNAYKRARERHPDWPTRNTIARAFGSWAQALRAAELAPSVASGEESSVSWARGSSGRSVSV